MRQQMELKERKALRAHQAQQDRTVLTQPCQGLRERLDAMEPQGGKVTKETQGLKGSKAQPAHKAPLAKEAAALLFRRETLPHHGLY